MDIGTNKIDDFPKPEATWKHIVSYGETDCMRIVYYANYLHWFEQARSHFFRELGQSYLEIEKRGVFFPVIEAYCKYLSPAKYEDLILVRCGIKEWGKASLKFVYEIYNKTEDYKKITTGWTKHPCMDKKGKIVKVPNWLVEMVQNKAIK
ncbi:thioesterase family protein [Desulfothermus naphthae]